MEMVDTFVYESKYDTIPAAIGSFTLANEEFGLSETIQHELPTLESILQEKESDVYHFEDLNFIHVEEGVSDDGTISVTSEVLPPPPKFSLSDLMKTKKPSLHGSVLRHVILRKMSSQMNDACQRRDAGLPTCLAVSHVVVIGTSHGISLVFEPKLQILKLVLGTKHDGDKYGAITALGINGECSRLLCGYARGQVTMWDLSNGNCLRVITEAHPEGFAVLHLQFTDDPSVALLNDSSGSVYTLSFKRLITRTCESSCFFSGHRGEVCVMAPLHNGPTLKGTPLQNTSLLAMASLTKLIVVNMTHKPIAVFTQKISVPQECLPLLCWYYTLVESKVGEKFIAPVLAFGLNQKMLLYRVERNGEEFQFICYKKLKFDYTLIATAWLNSQVIATIDTLERLRTIDVRSGEELECLDLSSVQLVYGSSYIKSIPNDGEISNALRLACEYACYQSVHFYNGQLLLLGTRSVHCLTIRNWKDRLDFFVRRNEFLEALRLARLFYLDQAKAVIGLVGNKKSRRTEVAGSIIDILLSYLDISMVIHCPKTNDVSILSPYYQQLVIVSIDYCLLVNDIETLFTDVYERFIETATAKREFLHGLENVIIEDKLTSLSAVLMQDLIEHFESDGRLESLQSCLVHLDLSSIDIDHMVKLCRKHQLYDLILYVYNKGLNDYITPFESLLSLLRESLSGNNGKTSDVYTTLGYKLLVYFSCCLAGNQYPIGKISDDSVGEVKRSVFDFVMVKRNSGSSSSEIYPNITTLLLFDTIELLNVLSLAFEEEEFDSLESGSRSRRQLVVDILLHVMLNKETFTDVQLGYLFTFIARQMARYGNSIHVSKLLFEQVLEYLTNPEEEKRHGEREQALLELLNAGGLDYFDDVQIVQLAEEAKFYRVCEVIYKKEREYYKVLSCYWRDTARKNQVYVYIDSIVFSEYCTDLDKEEILKAILSSMDHLVEINSMKFARLIISHFPAAFNDVAGKLQGQPEIQYAFLKGVFDTKSEVKFEKQKFHIDPEIHEKFIELMCIYEPDSLCTYLQSNDHYRLQEVYNIVDEKKLVQACAYLLERMGDVSGAFKLLRDDLQSKVDGVNDVFLSVDIDECELSEDIKSIINSCRRALLTVMQMCQRNSTRLERSDRESLWFSLLETMMIPQRRIKNASSPHFLIFKELTKDVLINMMEFISLPAVLHKMMQNPAYSSGKFSEIKDLIFGMIDTYNYELTLLETTRNLLDADLLGQYKQEKRVSSRGFRPNRNCCYLCNRNFAVGRSNIQCEFILFRCSHTYHRDCLQGAVGFDEELTCLQCDKSSIIRTSGFNRSSSRQGRGKSISQK